MWIKILQVRLLIITLSLYKKRAKNIYIIKEHFHWQSRVQTLSKITKDVYIIKLISYRFVHICTLERISQKEVFRKHQYFSDDSSEHLWLVVAVINSTESLVIGYNAALFKRVCLWLSASQRTADLNLASDDMTHWTI